MSPESQDTAGILLVAVPAVEFGGATLLGFIRRRTPGYLDNPLRRSLFRAGHAHAGVLVVLALVGLLYVDAATLSDGAKSVARSALALAPILIPAGLFFSVAPPRATRPNRLIALVYLGAASLAVGVVTLGVGLLR
jgi:hypothetical protein